MALTGKLAFTGDAQLKGLTVAVEHANNNDGILGRKIVLQVEDNGGDPKLAVSSIRKQLEVADVRLLYVGLTHIVQAVKQPLAKHKALVLYGAAIPRACR